MKTSLIITTENRRGPLLIRAIAGGLNQSKPLHEVIVINDGLTPLSLPHDDRIVCVSTEGQEGASAARNRGLEVVDDGVEAICYLDDDDEILPNHHEVMSALVQDSAFAFSKAIFRHSNNGDIKATVDPEPNNNGPKKYYDPYALLEQNIAPISSFIHKRNCDIKWDSSLLRMEDWDFWGRMFIKYGPPAKSNLITNVIYKNNDNTTSSHLGYSLSCSWRDIVSDRLKHLASENRYTPNEEDIKKFHIPKVGVVLPFYNSEKYIEEAIKSLLAQTYRDFEILAINDGSTDNSRRIVENMALSDSRIRLFDMPFNSGVTKALNFGLLVSRSQYIARMDADDFSFPNRLEEQVKFLDSNKDISILGTWFASKDESLSSTIWFNETPTTDAEIKEQMKTSCPIGHPTVMMRRRTLEQAGGYNESEEFEGVEDFELWTRLSKNYKFSNLPIHLLDYRTHENQATQRRRTDIKSLKERMK